MNNIAHLLDRVLNGDLTGEKRVTGFVLLVFPFEGHGGRCNYISNATRADVVTMLKEAIRGAARCRGARIKKRGRAAAASLRFGVGIPVDESRMRRLTSHSRRARQ